MSNEKPVTTEQRLGGGLVLVSNPLPFSPLQQFQLYQHYSLGENAFYVEDGLVNDAMFPLKLTRMGDIRQLQILSTVRVDARSKRVGHPHTFWHTRLIHNLRAGALHGVIGRACGFKPEELAVGILADCMHDNFTCAGGDSWKDINHQKTLFDEDEDFAGKIFRYYDDGWRSLCFKHGLEPKSTAQLMQEIVDGRGLAGEIHEIADTASYMLGDLEEIAKTADSRHNAEDFAEILAAAKHPWDIWNCLMEKDGHIVVMDPLALNNFLLLRVLLWKNFYQNPKRKVLELLMRDIVYPWLVSRKIIQISDLPVKGDTWLSSKVNREMGWEYGQNSNLSLLGSFPRLKCFATWGEALVFEKEKYASGAFTLAFSVKDFQKTNSKTEKYRVFGWDGRVDTFKSVYPPHAAVVDRIAADSMSPALPVHVVYVENPQLSDNFRKAWHEAREKWRKKID